MYKVEICESIDVIGEDTWDRLNTYFCDPMLSYGWINSVEKIFSDRLYPRHIVIYKNDKIFMILPSYIQYDDLYKTTNDIFFGRFEPLAKKIGISFSPSLVIYSPFSFHSGLLIDQVKIDSALITLIEESIEKICKKERVCLSGFPYLSNRYAFLFEMLSQRNYAKTFVAALAYLDIQWDSFSEYLQDLKAYRLNMYKNAKKEINRFRKSDAEVKMIDDFSQFVYDMNRIYNELYCRYNNKNCCLTKYFFEILAKEKNTRAIVASLNGRLIGFSLIIEKGALWDLKFSAHDVSEQRRTHSYFNLMFYQPIELAIKQGIKRITFGAGSLGAKLSRGCKIEPLFFLAKHRKPLCNSMLRLYLKGVGRVYWSKYQRQCLKR